MTEPNATDWVGRTQTLNDQISPAPVRLMRAMLDHAPDAAPLDSLPPWWHWL